MSELLKFKPKYLIVAILVFIVEVMIALFVHDRFIRPYIGDVLVVVLIYSFAKSFLNLPVLPVAIGVLLFAFGTEVLQYFNIVERIGLGHSKLARIVIGTSFAWEDFLAYLVGVLFVIMVEKRRIH